MHFEKVVLSFTFYFHPLENSFNTQILLEKENSLVKSGQKYRYR